MARERVALKPGWANAPLPEEFFLDTDFLKIISFFVFYAFKPSRSSKGRSLKDYKWPKDVWKNTVDVGLKEVLIYAADLHIDSQSYDLVTREPIAEVTFVSCNSLDNMRDACQRAGVQSNFTKTRDVNRIAVYNSEGNIMLSVFDHIRNAFAHGRFAIYQDGFIALESGKKVFDRDHNRNMFDIRARMLLKKETLLLWIQLIESGRLDETIVKEIEAKRLVAKNDRKKQKKQKSNSCIYN